MLRPKALDHVGLTVTDMDRTLRFYRLLGLEVLRRSVRRGGVTSAVLRVGSQEINVFSHPDMNPADEEHRQRIDHFCLEMDGTSIDELVRELTQAGVKIAQGPVARRAGTALFVQDPDGIRVELTIQK
jgi:catechol 2,3-dioxygenase-like lactoylglutathione lyase family enzyme